MKRILLKISGEALKGKQDFGIDPVFTKEVVEKIKQIKETGIELAIVIGGGNIYRGSNLIQSGVKSADSHNLSMLSTVFNGVVLKNFLEQIGIEAVVLNPLGINFLEEYTKENAFAALESNKIVILVGGTGNPYFTTDTGGVLRALELECDMMIKATKVDGVYDSDPVKNPDAQFYSQISCDDFIKQDLRILDQTAVQLAKENNLKIQIVNLSKPGAILNVINGKEEGSVIS